MSWIANWLWIGAVSSSWEIFRPLDSDFQYDAWGKFKTTTDFSVFHWLWTFNIPLELWNVYDDENLNLSNVSDRIISNRWHLEVKSWSDEWNTGKLRSKRNPRYQPNRWHLYSTAWWMPSADSVGIRQWWVGTNDNGVYFELEDWVLYAVIKSWGTVKTKDIITMPDGFDIEKGNLYDIQFQWRGVGNYYFYLNWKIAHTISYLWQQDLDVTIQNPAMPVHFYSENTNWTEVIMWFGCVDVTSEGGDKENRQYWSVSNTGENQDSWETPLIAIYNNTSFNWKINTKDFSLRRISTSWTDENITNVYVTKDPAAFSWTTWTDVDSWNDSIQYSKWADVSFTNTQYVKNTYTGRVDVDDTLFITNPDDEFADFYITPWDYVLVTTNTAGSGDTCYWTIEWSAEI